MTGLAVAGAEATGPGEAPVRRGFFRRRVVDPLVALLSQGLTPEKLALTFAVGLCLAAIPVIGATTALCTTAALVLRLNMPLMQAINYLSAPIQLVLLIPFMRLGALIFGGPGVRFSIAEIVHMVGTAPAHAVTVLFTATVRAVGAWALVAPLAGLLLYAALVPFFRHLRDRLARRAGAARA